MVGESIAARREEPDQAVLRAAEILGGKHVWKHPPVSKLQVHEAILAGIPGTALIYFLDHVAMSHDAIAEVLGISSRSVQRYTAKPVPLKGDPGARLWKLAEILAAASKLQGGLKEGKEWLEMPAPALNQKTPLEMMTTQPGAEMVEQLIRRLEHGVYT